MNFPVPKRYRDFVLHPFRKQGQFTALFNVSATVGTGDRVAVLGPNGAGKTTFLKLVGGLLLPSEGRILVNGNDTRSANQEARKSVGFVMNEERSFYWRLTGIQNLEFFGMLDNLKGNDLRDKVHELISLVGLEEAAKKPVGTYSSGMKQRLAMARGLLSNPDVLILDEPTRTLDPIACEELVELILEKIHVSRKTLFIATHRLEEARRLCTNALVIYKGQLISQIKLHDLTKRQISLEQHYRICVNGRETVQHDDSVQSLGVYQAGFSN